MNTMLTSSLRELELDGLVDHIYSSIKGNDLLPIFYGTIRIQILGVKNND